MPNKESIEKAKAFVASLADGTPDEMSLYAEIAAAFAEQYTTERLAERVEFEKAASSQNIDDDEEFDEFDEDRYQDQMNEEYARCTCGAKRFASDGRRIQVADCVCC